ncbi:MAG TPA: hypothetical protein VIM77_14900 [Mucilaginibacter sp.]
MDQKIVHIAFNRNIYIQNQKNFWSHTAGKVIKKYTFFSLLGLACTAIGYLDGKNAVDSFVKSIGMGYLFYMLMVWMALLERRVKFFKTVNQRANQYELESLDCTFIFNDAGFEYVDKEKQFRFNWSLLKPVTAIKDNIVIAIKDPAYLAFTISRRDIGDDEYNELYQFLTQKTASAG